MINDLLKKRCSIRKFKDIPISDKIVDYIIETGRLSPSGGNEQPWMFGIIDNKDLINSIADTAYNQAWIKESPLLIVLCTVIIEDERGARDIQISRFPEWKDEIYKMDKGLYSAINSEEHQTKIPGVHMVLAALEHGIMSTWVSYFEVNKVKELLKLPSNLLPSEILVFGYPDEEYKEKKKKSREEIVFTNYYR